MSDFSWSELFDQVAITLLADPWATVKWIAVFLLPLSLLSVFLTLKYIRESDDEEHREAVLHEHAEEARRRARGTEHAGGGGASGKAKGE